MTHENSHTKSQAHLLGLAAAAALTVMGAMGQAAVAQTSPSATTDPAAACVSKEEVAQAQTRTNTFLDNNTSQLRQADMDKVRDLLSKVMEPMRTAATTGCAKTDRTQVQAQVRAKFEDLYAQVGVGGRMLFDNYQVPMYQQQWMGGNANR